LAKLESVPPGTAGQVLGGDQRIWLRLLASETVVILDYRGAPYLRFSPRGVDVNRNSEMYYLNQPTPLTPPRGLGTATRPVWVRASFGRAYAWHDGRLHALASIALVPGQRYVGRWSIPAVVDGRRVAIGGSGLHRDGPSIAWFWPAVVLILCVIAGWRVNRPTLDRWMARGLAGAILIAVGLALSGRELYGQPMVTAGQFILFGLVLAFLVAAAGWLLSGRLGFVGSLVIAMAALGEALVFVPTLLDGYVFTTLPAFLIRLATVICLGAGPSLLLIGFRLTTEVAADEARTVGAGSEDELALSP
jgi:hypothetical protein